MFHLISSNGSILNPFERFNQLTVATTQNAIGLSSWIRDKRETVLLFSNQAKSYFTRFELYLISLGQCVQAGLFDLLSDDIRSRLEKKSELYTHLITPDDNMANGIIDALCFPITELKHYQRFLASLGGIVRFFHSITY